MAMHLAPQDLGNGRKSSGYFASDLTLEQIKTLWATQSFPERDQSQDGKYRWAAVPLTAAVMRRIGGGQTCIMSALLQQPRRCLK